MLLLCFGTEGKNELSEDNQGRGERLPYFYPRYSHVFDRRENKG